MAGLHQSMYMYVISQYPVW